MFGLFTEMDGSARSGDSFTTYRKTCLLQKFPEFIVSAVHALLRLETSMGYLLSLKITFSMISNSKIFSISVGFFLLRKDQKHLQNGLLIAFRLYIYINSLIFSILSLSLHHTSFFVILILQWNNSNWIIPIIPNNSNSLKIWVNFNQINDLLFLSEKLELPFFFSHCGHVIKIFIQLPIRKIGFQICMCAQHFQMQRSMCSSRVTSTTIDRLPNGH